MNVPLPVAILSGVLVLCASDAVSRGATTRPPEIRQVPLFDTSRDVPREPALRSALLPDTTVLGAWDFEGCAPQGWTSVDVTAQGGTYFHVDDFAGLGGGMRGLLYAPEGNQAMWCGLRPDPNDAELCRYAALPGYANNWNQRFGTMNCLDVTGDVEIHFLSTWDSEPGYDGTCVQFDKCDGNWTSIIATSQTYYFSCIDGWGAGPLSATVPDSLHDSSIRIRFRFGSDGAWSDEDGMWPGDGAIIIDSLSVTDAGGAVIPTETFETEAVGDRTTTSGNWVATPAPGYGDFSGLFDGLTVLQEDPCNSNLSCIWGFFSGSTADYSCGGHPEQPAVPYENERGQYLQNDIWSPWIPLAGTGGRFVLEFDVYGDTPLDALVFYVIEIRSRVNGCATNWTGTNFTYHEPEKIWKRHRLVLDPYVDPAATDIQISIGAFDTCDFRCGVFGTGDCHSHSPLIDNVLVYRVESVGPEWDVATEHLFQDNFPSDGTTTGLVRADMADDLLKFTEAPIRPGDSTVVAITTPAAEPDLGIDPHTGSGPAAYAYITVKPEQAGKRGSVLSGDASRWPVVDSLTTAGTTWWCLRMDSVYSDGLPVANRYCVDLNDSLFTPGDTVSFFFGATTSGAVTTYWSEFTGTTYDLNEALSWPMEFTCLPTTPSSPPYRVLYVDYAEGTGAQTAFDAAFDALGIKPFVDRYDARGADNRVENSGPASRISDPATQLIDVYDIIIWSGGTRRNCLGNGSQFEGKSDDDDLLAAFMNAPCPGGIYFSGDDIAGNIDDAGFDSPLLPHIQFNLVHRDHTYYGYDPSPLVVATGGGWFDHADSDSMVAFRGCYPVNHFDVISPAGSATMEASYTSGGAGGAIVAQRTAECPGPGGGSAGGIILSGFGFESIVNDTPSSVLDATAHMADVIAWLLDTPTGIESPARVGTTLKQNYPNPFNPVTAIRYSVRERARVQIRVYSVAGQLVTTLVDREVAPGVEHAVEWDGRNGAGQRVATGVYFYRMTAPDFVRTRKMVLLK